MAAAGAFWHMLHALPSTCVVSYLELGADLYLSLARFATQCTLLGHDALCMTAGDRRLS